MATFACVKLPLPAYILTYPPCLSPLPVNPSQMRMRKMLTQNLRRSATPSSDRKCCYPYSPSVHELGFELTCSLCCFTGMLTVGIFNWLHLSSSDILLTCENNEQCQDPELHNEDNRNTVHKKQYVPDLSLRSYQTRSVQTIHIQYIPV